MAVFTDPADILNAVAECQKHTQDLRDRMEEDFSLWRLDPYRVGKNEGDYRDFTTNSPAVLGNKVIDLLSNARLRFTIPISDENEEERQHLSLTERFVYGAVNLADERLAATVAPPIQSQLAWYATLRGWYVIRCFMRRVGDGNREITVPDIAVWDILNTYWGLGAGGINWACYKRYASAEQVRGEYGMEVPPDDYGRVAVYDYWDDENEAVIIGDSFVKSPEPHGLDQIPVLIGTVGATPLVQSMACHDTIRNVGESVYANNRHVYPKQSEMLSYYLTVTAMGARTPLVVYYSGETPPEFENNPYAKGNVIFLKKGKEEARELLKADLPRDANILLNFLGQQVSIGGLPPISYGEIDHQLPAAGIGMLTHSALSILKPRQKAIELAFEWIARELIAQYKSGRFTGMKLQGMDSTDRHFHVRVKPDEICDEWRIVAELVPELPQDELQNAGIATQLVKAEIISRETAMDKYLHVPDTDSEAKKIAREQAENLPPIKLRRLAAALLKDGREDLAQVFLDEIERGESSQGEPKAPKIPAVPGIPAPVPPQAAAAPSPMLSRAMAASAPEGAGMSDAQVLLQGKETKD